MEKTVKKADPARIKEAKENMIRMEKVKVTCGKILSTFETDGEAREDDLLALVEQIGPWQDIPFNDKWGASTEQNDLFDRLYEAMQVCFGFGYTVGQMLDVPGVDTTPIQEFLRERKSLLYFPHKKKAA